MPDASSIAQRRRLSAGSVWLMLTLLVLGSVGCRGLRRGQRDQGLNEARYFSLRGADALQVAKVEDAEALFAEALRRCPNDERAHWGMSEIHSQRGDCQAAAFHMQEAARMSGNNPDLLVKLGEIYLQAGKVSEAQAQAELALAANRQHAGAWQLLGRVAEHEQQWEEAMQRYHRALMSKPNSPAVQLALAGVYQRLGRPQRALATLERMSDLQSQEYRSAAAWLLKGQALASLGQIDEAKLCLQEASSRAQTGDHRLFLQMARLYSDVGELAEARVTLGQVLSLQADHPEALALQRHLDQQFSLVGGNPGPSPATPTIGIMPVSGPRGETFKLLQ